MGGKPASIINSVRIARKTAGFSQVELGKKVGVTRQTILTIEAQRYPPSLELAFRLSYVLDMKIEDLFVFKPEWLTKDL